MNTMEHSPVKEPEISLGKEQQRVIAVGHLSCKTIISLFVYLFLYVFHYVKPILKTNYFIFKNVY